MLSWFCVCFAVIISVARDEEPVKATSVAWVRANGAMGSDNGIGDFRIGY